MALKSGNLSLAMLPFATLASRASSGRCLQQRVHGARAEAATGDDELRATALLTCGPT